MRTNARTQRKPIVTHEGAPAKHISPLLQLRRSVMSTLLFEDQFYEDGQPIADRIMALASKVKPEQVATVAIDARENGNLRHVPLLLALSLVKNTDGKTSLPSDTIARVIQRADEILEFFALYKKYNKGETKLSKQLRVGLAKAFLKFDHYQFSKYDKNSNEWSFYKVIQAVHPKPETKAQKALFAKIASNELGSADTWEAGVVRAAKAVETEGKTKQEVAEDRQEARKDVFEKQLQTGKLGYMALLRNLRNMTDLGIDTNRIKTSILNRRGASRVLPFRFVAAARAAPQFERELDQALVQNISEAPPLRGKTVVLVDVSYSMVGARLSEKSDMDRMTAAATLASVINAEDLRVFSFSNSIVEVPPRRGMAGVDAVIRSQPHNGTYLGSAVSMLNHNVPHDRLIVVTDEQSHDRVPDPVAKHAYMINVASYKNGVGYGRWTHIDGFSENVLRFIMELENLDAEGA